MSSDPYPVTTLQIFRATVTLMLAIASLIANSAHSFICALFLHHTVIGNGARFFHDKKTDMSLLKKGRYLEDRCIRTWCMDWRRLYPVFYVDVPPWILRSQFFARWPHTDSGKCAPRGTWPKRKDLYYFFLIITICFQCFGSGFDCRNGSGSGKPIASCQR